MKKKCKNEKVYTNEKKYANEQKYTNEKFTNKKGKGMNNIQIEKSIE